MVESKDPLIRVLNSVAELREDINKQISKLPAPSPAKEMLGELETFLGTVDLQVRGILARHIGKFPPPDLTRIIRDLPRPKRTR